MEKIVFSKEEFIHPKDHLWEKKKEIRKFCKKISMNVNLPVEYNAEKYDLNYKSHIYNTKTMTQSYKPVNSKPVYTFPD